MSIATIITAGFGSFGTVNLVITDGFSAGAPAPATALHGFGFLEYDKGTIETLKEHYKKTEAARLRNWRDANRAERRLSEAVRRAYDSAAGKSPEIAQRLREAVLSSPEIEAQIEPNWALIARDRENVQKFIQALEFESILNAQKAKDQADADEEDDLDVILLTMH